MSKEAGEYNMPEDFDEMISLYKRAYDITGGLVTPLIGQVLIDSGYDATYSLIPKDTIPKARPWGEILDWKKSSLFLKEPAILDFGACGKGYLVDIVSDIIEKEGIKSYVVDASGDMRQRSQSGELRVGLEHPEDKKSVIGVVKIKNQSLCGSAGNRRKWADMHHIINPETLSSPKHILSVWVVAETTILSDILTTCLFFVTPEEMKKHFSFEYLILNSDYSVSKSESLDVEIFSK